MKSTCWDPRSCHLIIFPSGSRLDEILNLVIWSSLLREVDLMRSGILSSNHLVIIKCGFEEINILSSEHLTFRMSTYQDNYLDIWVALLSFHTLLYNLYIILFSVAYKHVTNINGKGPRYGSLWRTAWNMVILWLCWVKCHKLLPICNIILNHSWCTTLWMNWLTKYCN